MSFDIYTVLGALKTIEESVAITVPSAMQMKKVYRTIPTGKGTPETPCTLHLVRPLRVSHIAGARAQIWQIRTQLLVHDASQDIAGDVVLNFAMALLNAVSNNLRLNDQPVILTDWSAQSDIPARLEYAGAFYLGADFVTTVTVPLEAVTVGP